MAKYFFFRAKYSVFTSARCQLILSKGDNINVEGEFSSIDEMKCWISESEQFKALASVCGLRRAEHNEEDPLTPLELDAFGFYSPRHQFIVKGKKTLA